MQMNFFYISRTIKYNSRGFIRYFFNGIRQKAIHHTTNTPPVLKKVSPMQ
jgi:hypothetical protein